MKRRADRQCILVEYHLRGMESRDRTPSLRPRSEKRHRAGHPLKNVRKIFAGHDRRWQDAKLIPAEQFSTDRPDGFDDIGMVHDRRVAGIHADLRCGIMGRGDFFSERGNGAEQARQRLLRNRPDRAAENCRFRDRTHFMGPRLQGSDRHNGGLEGLHAPRDVALQGKHDLRSDWNWIQRMMWLRWVSASALDHNSEQAGAGHKRSRPRGHFTAGIVGRDVEGERGVRLAVPIEQPFFDHQPRSSVPLLSRLERKDDPPGNVFPTRGEKTGSSDQHCRVPVVTARVHRPVDLGSIIEAGRFLYLESVHICPQEQRRYGRCSRQNRYYRREPLPDRDFEIERIKGFDDRGLRPREHETYFGVPVKAASQPDDIRKKSARLVEKFVEIMGHPFNSLRPARGFYSASFLTRSMTSRGWFITSRICVSTSSPLKVSISSFFFFASSTTSASLNAFT